MPTPDIPKYATVCLSVPSTGHVHTELTMWIVQAVVAGHIHTVHFPVKKPFTAARSEQVRHFLHDTDCSHLLLIDHDTVPPGLPLPDMLQLKAGFVAIPTPAWASNSDFPKPTLGILNGEYDHLNRPTHLIPAEIVDSRGVCEIHRSGLACCLISRPFLNLAIEQTRKQKLPLFIDTVNHDGEIIEEADFRFCRLLREAKLSLIADCRHGMADHHKEINLNCVLTLASNLTNALSTQRTAGEYTGGG
jgi:hypothetical protein